MSPQSAAAAKSPSARIVLFTDGGEEAHKLQQLIVDTWEIPVHFLSRLDEAIEAFHGLSPDLVVVDHGHATELLHRLRQDWSPNAFLPILVLVSDEDRSEWESDMLAGAADLLMKPIDPVEALLRIHNLLSLRETRTQLHNRVEMVEHALQDRIAALRQQMRKLHRRDHSTAQQARLQALGTMASGVAHDFGNVLAAIMGFTELLLREEESTSVEQRRRYLRTVLTAAEDGAQIVHRLREFYRPATDPDVRIPVDLNEVVRQSAELTRPRWGTQMAMDGIAICLRTRLQPIPAIQANPAELREMLTNLIFNAVDALPQGGEILISTAHDSSEVVLQIADTGTGMTEKVRRQCLEPFFTTKGHHGTGMGLAMVHGIAERHGATLELKSQLGEGTSFCFRFPARVGQQPQQVATPEMGAGTLDILVLDDEPIIAEIIAELLMKDGHRVVTETDPKAALKMMEAAQFDLLITDKSMPAMDGPEFAALAKATAPNVRVLLVTGFGAEEQGGECIDHVIGKPVDIDTLRQGVAEAFGSHAATAATSALSPRQGKPWLHVP